jgi:hypothetical protein
VSEAETIVAPTWRAHIANPKPAYCAGCLRGADAGTIFVDLGMPSDRGFVRAFGTQAVIADLNRLCLCQSCVSEMAECLAFDPLLHATHRAQIEQVKADRDRLARENVMLRALVAEGVVPPKPAKRPYKRVLAKEEGDAGWNDAVDDSDER